MKAFCQIGAASAFVLAVAAWPVDVIAQTVSGQSAAAAAKKPEKKVKAAAAKKDPAAQKADTEQRSQLVESGIASFNSGKHDLAVQQLSSALSGGKLPSAQMARALYYRGAAHRKQSKPALAISDLTSALWLKNGLGEAERGDAMAQRAAAYREAGLPDQADGAAAAQPKTASASPLSADRATPSARNAAPAASPPQTTAAIPALPAAARTSPQPVLAAAPAPTGQSVAPPASEGGVSGFFSNLFGGGSASTATAAPAPAPTRADTGTSGWSQATEIKKPGTGASPTRVATVAPPAAAPAAAKPEGRYQLQVAAVRSRDEAQAIAQRLPQQYATDIGSRRAQIDEAVMGNMGTVYRVRIGPFTDASEPRALCTKLRASGLDCLLIGQ